MFSQRFEELGLAISQCSYMARGQEVLESEAISLVCKMIRETASRGGIVYVIGNGGSAGIASHFSNDLMKALKIPSQTLYDSNLVTCLANDIGYENVFSYPLEKLLKSVDLLVAISSSGKSPNIVNGANVALNKGASLITLSGFQPNNPLRRLGQINYWIDRCDYGLVEIAHFFFLHTIVDLWSKNPSPVLKYAQIH